MMAGIVTEQEKQSLRPPIQEGLTRCTSSSWIFDPRAGEVSLEPQGSDGMITHAMEGMLPMDVHVHTVRFDGEPEQMSALARSFLSSDEEDIDLLHGPELPSYADIVVAAFKRFSIGFDPISGRVRTIKPTVIESINIQRAHEIVARLKEVLPTEYHDQIIASPVLCSGRLFSPGWRGPLPLIVVTHSRIKGFVPPKYQTAILYPNIANPLQPDLAIEALFNGQLSDNNGTDELLILVEPTLGDPNRYGARTALHALGAKAYRDPYNEYPTTLNRIRSRYRNGLARKAETIKPEGEGSATEVSSRNTDLVGLNFPIELYLDLLSRYRNSINSGSIKGRKLVRQVLTTQEQDSEENINTKWFPDRKLFEEIMGVSWDRYVVRVILDDQQMLLRGVAEWEFISGLREDPELIGDHVQLTNTLDRVVLLAMSSLSENRSVNYDQVINKFMRELISRSANRLDIAVTSLNNLFSVWSQTGKLDPVINNFRRAVEASLTRVIAANFREYMPILRELELSPTGSASENLGMIRSHLVKELKLRIRKFYDDEGIYFIRPRAPASNVLGCEDVTFSDLERLVGLLRSAASSTRMQKPALDPDGRGGSIMGSILMGAVNELVTEGSIQLAEDPYGENVELERLKEFVRSRADKAGIKRARDIPFQKDEGIEQFEKIFLINPRTLNNLLRSRYDLTVGKLMDSILEEVDKEFALARSLYFNPKSPDEFAEAMARRLIECGVSLEDVMGLSVSNIMLLVHEGEAVFPPPLVSVSDRREMSVDPLRSQFRSLARTHNIEALELLRKIQASYEEQLNSPN